MIKQSKDNTLKKCDDCYEDCFFNVPNAKNREGSKLKDQVDGLLTAKERLYLDQLGQRLKARGFSWNHEDYFILQNIIPKINDNLR